MRTDMKRLLRRLRYIRALNAVRRFHYASSHYLVPPYLNMLRWLFTSREDTNYTYDLTETNLAYLAQTVALVTGSDHHTITGYIDEARHDQDLARHIRIVISTSTQKGVCDEAVRFGRRLGWYAFARAMKPSVVVETGVDKGQGAVLLCAALLRNREEGHEGRYFGTDINPRAGFLLVGRYREVGEVLYGDSIESLSKFASKIDLFINDSDHSAGYEYREYSTVKPLLSERSIILGDNAHVTDKLLQFSLENSRKFLFFHEKPKDHWYPGAGIGISWK